MDDIQWFKLAKRMNQFDYTNGTTVADMRDYLEIALDDLNIRNDEETNYAVGLLRHATNDELCKYVIQMPETYYRSISFDEDEKNLLHHYADIDPVVCDHVERVIRCCLDNKDIDRLYDKIRTVDIIHDIYNYILLKYAETAKKAMRHN